MTPTANDFASSSDHGDHDGKSFISSANDHAVPSLPRLNGSAYHPHASTTTLANSVNPALLGYDPRNEGMRTLAVDGADDDRDIVFSATGNEKKVIYKFSTPKAPDTNDFPIEVQGLVEDVDLVGEITSEHSYTVRAGRDCKNFTIIPQSGPTGTNIIMRPTKSLATYKGELQSPAGLTWYWKGNIYKNMELFEKNKRGEKKIIAIYVRTSMGSHQFRIYKDLLPDDQLIYQSSALSLAIASLYPFLAMYRQALAKDFTSDRRVLQKSATAQPSGWDAKFMGSDPALKKKKKQGQSPDSSPNHSAAGTPSMPTNGTDSNGANYQSGKDDQSIKTTTKRRWLPFRKED
ncbi:unnamed protein product [Sympodiomycopsis kandeliae]